MKRVLNVSGGITGAAAAYHLEEKARAVGVAGGPDCFVRERPSVAGLAERLGIADKLLPSIDVGTGTSVLHGGRLHKVPNGLMLLVPTKIIPFALSSLLSWSGRIRMGLDPVLPEDAPRTTSPWSVLSDAALVKRLWTKSVSL